MKSNTKFHEITRHGATFILTGAGVKVRNQGHVMVIIDYHLKLQPGTEFEFPVVPGTVSRNQQIYIEAAIPSDFGISLLIAETFVTL